METEEQKSILKKLRKLDPCLCVKYENSFFDKKFHSFGDLGTWVHGVRAKEYIWRQNALNIQGPLCKGNKKFVHLNHSL